ncbi:MAG: HD-GYP domain-containing protein [Acidobacteriota bacterium]
MHAAVMIGIAIMVASALHFSLPVGVHSWHWLHLLAQKIYLLPVLMAAAWFGLKGTLLCSCLVTLVFAFHIFRDWRGYEMVQADQLADVVNLWIVALLSSILFGRIHQTVKALARARDATLAGLAASLDLREHGTSQHSRRVQAYALILAERVGTLDESGRRSLAIGALLHDIGKIGVPDAIILKPGALTAAERREMRRHPELGAQLVERLDSLAQAREVILCHHERFDGTGYPRGLAGSMIPLPARIFAVVDAFDALTSDRPYQRAASYTEAAGRIAMDWDRAFDPLVVDAFFRVPFEEWARAGREYGVELAEVDLGPESLRP